MVLIRHIWQHTALRGTEQNHLSRHDHVAWHCTVTIVQLIHTSPRLVISHTMTDTGGHTRAALQHQRHQP
jgi:hypothetical protein